MSNTLDPAIADLIDTGQRKLQAVADAQQQAYRLAKEISWNGSFYRTDIGYRAIARERGEHQQ